MRTNLFCSFSFSRESEQKKYSMRYVNNNILTCFGLVQCYVKSNQINQLYFNFKCIFLLLFCNGLLQKFISPPWYFLAKYYLCPFEFNNKICPPPWNSRQNTISAPWNLNMPLHVSWNFRAKYCIPGI